MKLTVQCGTEICLNKNAVVKLPRWQELWWCGHSPVRASHSEIWPVRRSGSFSEKVLELKFERSEGALSRGSGEGRTHWTENTAVWFPILALGCCCFLISSSFGRNGILPISKRTIEQINIPWDNNLIYPFVCVFIHPFVYPSHQPLETRDLPAGLCRLWSFTQPHNYRVRPLVLTRFRECIDGT